MTPRADDSSASERDSGALRVAVLLRRLRGDPQGAPTEQVLGHCEQAALAAALSVGARNRARVTALAVGPATREDRVLAMALRAGCHHAVRVYDDAVEGLDYLGVARVLAAALTRIGFDLVCCGDRSQDEHSGAVGPAVAELLGVHHVSNALDLRIDDEGALITCRGDGRRRQLRLALPCVAAMTQFPRSNDDDEAELLTSSHPGATIEELDLEDLGLEPRELTHRAQFVGAARSSRGGRQVTVLPSATALIARLRDDHLLE